MLGRYVFLTAVVLVSGQIYMWVWIRKQRVDECNTTYDKFGTIFATL